MCILLVEDEMLIRLIFSEELVEAGYEVCGVENGDQAESMIRERPAHLSLLITDLQMPGRMDGVKIARLLRRQRPDIPVIYMTGRPDILAELGPLGERDALLAKPFAPSALLRTVRRFLPGHPEK